MAKTEAGSALAEGFFWMGEQWRYGYEGIEPNPAEALKLYRQAADLGFARAHLRIGEMHERGVGLPADPAQALVHYRRAAQAGEITAIAAMARLVSRTTHAPKADMFWRKFFLELERGEHGDLGLDEPATSIHSYLFSKLARFEMPETFPIMIRYRQELIGYIQRYLEHAADTEQLDVMDAMMEWIKEKLPEE